MKPDKDRVLLGIVVVIVLGLVGFVTTMSDEDIDLDQHAGPQLETAIEESGPGDFDFDPLAPVSAEQKAKEAEAEKLWRKKHGIHGAQGVDVQVISRSTDRAVAGAYAFLVCEADISPVDWKFRRDQVALRQGRRSKTDDSGYFHVDSFIGAAYIVCIHDGHYGEHYVQSFHDLRTGEARVYIDADQSIALQVTDEKGQGLSGVPIALWRDNSVAAHESEGREPDRILVWSGTTMGPEGRAFARHSLGLAAAGMKRDPTTRAFPIVAELQRGRVYATFYFPPVIPPLPAAKAGERNSLAEASGQVRRLLDEVAEVTLTPAGPRVRPLVLPGTGSVKLRLYKDDAALFEEPCAVWIGPWLGQDAKTALQGGTQDLDPEPGSISGSSLPFISEGGFVILPRVGLDTIFDVTIMPVSGLHDPVQVPVVGPTRSGQIKVVDVPMGPERAVLDFVVKDEKGAALGGHWVDIELGVAGSTRLSPEAIKRQRLQTDTEGQVSLRVPVEFSRYEQMELRVTGMKSPGSLVAPYCAKLLETPPPAGHLDAGLIQLAGSSLVCKGRIVDESGRGVGDAQIRILRRPFADEERSASDERLVAWTKLADVERVMAEIRTSSKGYFVHGGYVPAGRWKIVVTKELDGVALGAEAEFEPGTTDLDLVLRPVLE